MHVLEVDKTCQQQGTTLIVSMQQYATQSCRIGFGILEVDGGSARTLLDK